MIHFEQNKADHIQCVVNILQIVVWYFVHNLQPHHWNLSMYRLNNPSEGSKTNWAKQLQQSTAHTFALTSLCAAICSLNNHSINAPLKRPLCLLNKASCKFLSHMHTLIALWINGTLSQATSHWKHHRFQPACLILWLRSLGSLTLFLREVKR